MKINNIIGILLIPLFMLASTSILLVFVEAPLYQLFNRSYKLPNDKAWIDVVPISSRMIHFIGWYTNKYLEFDSKSKSDFLNTIGVFGFGIIFWMIIFGLILG